MERIQQHKFVDLATPVKQPKESNGMSRRDFFAMATGVAAAAAMAPEAFARNFIDQYDPDGPIARYPNPDVIVLDKRFKVQTRQYAYRTFVSRHNVGGRPCLERSRSLSHLERHPEQHAAALARRGR